MSFFMFYLLILSVLNMQILYADVLCVFSKVGIYHYSTVLCTLNQILKKYYTVYCIDL